MNTAARPDPAIAKVLADIAEQGGGTYESGTYLPFTPTDGFAVGIGGIRLPEATVTAAELTRWLRAVVTEYEASFVGTWRDGGLVYIDAVRYIRDLPTALDVARVFRQKAIFDFSTKSSIALEA